MKNRDAYAKISNNGDIEEIVKIYAEECLGVDEGIVATIATSELRRILHELKSVYVLLFSSDRWLTEDVYYGSGNCQRKSVELPEKNLYCELVESGKEFSVVRGFRVMVSARDVSCKQRQQYESFIAYDNKHKNFKTISCDPEKVNSFQSGKFPHALTPVFFRPQILDKYKNDPQKYAFINDNRAVRCLDRWMMKFDINEENQVHAYLCDLSLIPYQEQSYWKSYNIESMGSISTRSFNTDLLCKFEDGQQPVHILKRNLKRLSEEKVEWWKLKNPDLLDRINSVFSNDNEKEWQDQIMFLDQLIVEGLNKKYFISRACKLNIEVGEIGSLVLIKKILIHQETQQEIVDMVFSHLYEIHQLRSLGAHISGPKNRHDVISKLLLENKGSFRVHFDHILETCNQSIELIAKLAREAIL